jgi:hypothetical protein
MREFAALDRAWNDGIVVRDRREMSARGEFMARMDAFSAQLVKFVRQMSDEALLDLVKQKLGVADLARGGLQSPGPAVRHAPGRGSPRDGAVDGPAPSAGKGKPPSPAKRSPEAARARRPSPSAERQALLDRVESVVKANPGSSASDVARLAGVPQTRAAAALKDLKLLKRIFQGGDRRFARYAGDLLTAEQASAAARKTAKGPTVPSRKGGVRPRKRTGS